MIRSHECLLRYGDPEEEKSLTVLQVPFDLRAGAIPTKIYCNKDLVQPLLNAFTLLKSRHLSERIKTWDGCFNIRNKKNRSVQKSLSLHSWGLAIDIDAAWNRVGRTPTLNPGIVACFKESGFDWGGDWKGKDVDGMHFQLSKFPG
jgi:hypothetical protein